MSSVSPEVEIENDPLAGHCEGFQSAGVVDTHTESLLAVQRGKLISENPEEEARQKAIKSLLNKVTPEKYAVILEKLMQVEIPSVLSLSGLIDQVGHPPAIKVEPVSAPSSVTNHLLRLLDWALFTSAH